MAYVKENDIMIDFYLSPSILQREILAEYQTLKTTNKNCESLVRFLEKKFKLQIMSIHTKKIRSNPHISQ
ncbi:MAG: hypothetical protein ACI8ZB_004127 [Desulforhopalus sp.]|jgi:hypothetical protein